MRMHGRIALVRAGRIFIFAAALTLLLVPRLGAQGFGAQGRNQVQNPATRAPRAAAPKDLTGYWESIVTEYWRYRMVVPDKSDYVIVPLNAEGRKVALATVVKTWGSAPRQAGSQVAVREDGAFVGSVSGGCVESAVIESAQDVIKTGAIRTLSFGVRDEDVDALGQCEDRQAPVCFGVRSSQGVVASISLGKLRFRSARKTR
jgi:hypothetical protein